MFRFTYQKAFPQRMSLQVSHRVVQTTSSRLTSTKSSRSLVSSFTKNNLVIPQAASLTRTFNKRDMTNYTIETPKKRSPEPTELPSFCSRAKELTK